MFRRRTIAIVFLGLALSGITVLPSRADELSNAVNQQQDILNRQNEAQGQLNKLTFTADKMKKQLDGLNAQIKTAQANLTQKKAAYDQAQKRVFDSEEDLQQKISELDARRQALRQRVRGIYENGQISYLEVLFDASNLADFVTRLEYLGHLVANDRQLLGDIQEQKAQIAQKTEELKSARDQAATLQAQAAGAKAELDNNKAQLQVTLDQNKKAQQEIFEEIDKFEADSKALADKIRQLQASRSGVNGSISTWPLPGYYEISSPFGWRTHPLTGQKKLHTGTDIPAPTGTPIHAAGDGVVIYAGWYGAYGNAVIIDHGKGYSTLYGHQSKIAVSTGQQVKAGQVIGNVGSTGWSTGPHLHFEVRIAGNPTDPLQYFH